MGHVRVLGVLAAIWALTARVLAQAPQYTLELLPGWGSAINDSNVIPLVKQYDATREIGGLYNANTGQFTPLTVAMPDVWLTDISSTGWVAGGLRPTGGTSTIVAWNPSRVRATIRSGVPLSVSASFCNSSGRVAWSETPPGSSLVGYAWAPVSGITSGGALNTIGGPKAVTPEGWIVGTTRASPTRASFVSASGVSQIIPLPPTATRSEGLDGNARGQFLLSTFHTGQSSPLRTYVWTRSTGVFKELANPMTGRLMQVATRFNDVGDCLGVGFVPPGPIPEAMLWVVNNGYTFRELLGGSLPPGWTHISVPTEVNNHGVIVGFGQYAGQYRCFVMKPIGPWHP